MYISRVLVAIASITYMLFVYFLFKESTVLADCFRALYMPILTVNYLYTVRNKSMFLTLFFLFTAISDFLRLFSSYFSEDLDYFLGNWLYILGFLSLGIAIAKNMNFNYLYKHYKFSIAVLFLLNIYIAYQLLVAVEATFIIDSYFFVDLLYIVTMLMVLSFSVLNYVNNYSTGAFLLLLAALCIVFSDVLFITYTYVLGKNIFQFLSTSFRFVGFVLLYKQAYYTKISIKSN